MTVHSTNAARISAIVPVRDEEAVIAACVESLAEQKEITEILVVDDQSTDHTGQIVRELTAKYARVRLIEAPELPPGWVGKNHAVWLGAKEAKEAWLLFTDADVLHGETSGARALQTASEQKAALVSYSPEQITVEWFEKALIPVVYCRLASKFSFDEVNDPEREAAAANGQFLMVSREAYDSVGGHGAIAGEVLEDVALAKRVKEAGFRIWFGSGKGIVRVRMYRSFGTMWEGWKKNLYRLMGGPIEAKSGTIYRATTGGQEVFGEILNAVGPLLLLLFAVVLLWGGSGNRRIGLLSAAVALGLWHWMYAIELSRNRTSAGLVWYGIPGKLLYAAVLWASYHAHRIGKLAWKGREYPAGTSGASKG